MVMYNKKRYHYFRVSHVIDSDSDILFNISMYSNK